VTPTPIFAGSPMPDTAASFTPPRAARTVVFRHEGSSTGATIDLEVIAARLSSLAAHGAGLGSRVWRIVPMAMAENRTERADDIIYACKWVNLDDPVRALHLPREFGWLNRLGGGYFPVPVAQAMLRPDAYLLVAEWIEGRNLALHAPAIVAELIAAGTFKRFCGDLIRILDRLQEAGVAHSDIWEPNIMVRDQRPVLLDFGWARTLGGAPARDNLHQPDDRLAMTQLLLRLGALRRMLTHPQAT
jgi:hypothetical protein